MHDRKRTGGGVHPFVAALVIGPLAIHFEPERGEGKGGGHEEQEREGDWKGEKEGRRRKRHRLEAPLLVAFLRRHCTSTCRK